MHYASRYLVWLALFLYYAFCNNSSIISFFNTILLWQRLMKNWLFTFIRFRYIFNFIFMFFNILFFILRLCDLETTDNAYVIFETLSTIKEAVVRELSILAAFEICEIRDYVLKYITSHTRCAHKETQIHNLFVHYHHYTSFIYWKTCAYVNLHTVISLEMFILNQGLACVAICFKLLWEHDGTLEIFFETINTHIFQDNKSMVVLHFSGNQIHAWPRFVEAISSKH